MTLAWVVPALWLTVAGGVAVAGVAGKDRGTGDPASDTAESAPAEMSAWSFSTRTMGTLATVQIVGGDSLAAADLAYDALVGFHEADALLSNWTDASEIARVNREAGQGWSSLGPELLMILDTAAEVYIQSAGTFDPTIEPLVRAWGFLGGTPQVPDASEIERARALVGWPRVELDLSAARIRFEDPAMRLDLGGIAKGYSVDLVAAQLMAAGVTGQSR